MDTWFSSYQIQIAEFDKEPLFYDWLCFIEYDGYAICSLLLMTAADPKC
jgi:hypothetical protein